MTTDPDAGLGRIEVCLCIIQVTTENLRILTETLMHSPTSLIRGIKVADRKPGDAPK
jgi:hypothetical protein